MEKEKNECVDTDASVEQELMEKETMINELSVTNAKMQSAIINLVFDMYGLR